MMEKISRLGGKSQDMVIVGPQDGVLDADSMDEFDVEPSSPVDADRKARKWARGNRQSVFKTQSAKSSIRSSYSFRSMRFQWRGGIKAVKMSTPLYKGDQRVGYVILFLQFLKTAVEVWWQDCTISTRLMRKIVIVEIALMILLGFMFTLAGVFKITRHQENEHSEDFYWAMTFAAIIVLTLSIMGSIGIFRPNIMVTEMFAVFSFIFGHLIFSIVVSWYLLVVLDSYFSHFHDDSRVNRKNNENAIGENIYKDEFLQDYFKLLIIISLVLMSSGVITTKLLIQIRRTQGYVNVYT